MMLKNQSQSGSSSRQTVTLACVVCLFVCSCSLAGTGVATAIRIRAHILPYKALRFTVGMESGTSSRRSVTLARVRFPILHSFRFPI